ncbi:MAG: YIP1 family protein [Bacteroidota bacterium]
MDMLICPQCGATLKEGAKFCHVCGYKVPEEEQKISEPEVESKNEEPHLEEPIDVHTFTDVKPDEVFSAVKSGNIFKRAINIMFKPKKEWEIVAKETPKIPMLILGYALVFSIIPLLALIVHDSFIVYQFTFHYYFQGTIFGVFDGFMFMISAMAAIIVGAIIINALAPAFKTEKNLGKAMQLTTYSFTPMFFAAAFYLIPYMSFVANLAGLYGIFLLLIGLPIIMKTPKNTQIGYFFTSIGILFGIFFTIYWTTSAIMGLLFKAILGYSMFY